ncbi:gliding motility-associated C-terminal domain-containing protein [Bacteroidota bacterium]
MRKFLIICFFGLLLAPTASATHNRAGEITLVQIDDFTYEILIQTFTYSKSEADRNELDVKWGDGTTSSAGRFSKLSLPNFYFWNRYTAVHTFPGPGTYTIVVQDPNRNYGVLNIPNSVNVIFSIKTTIAINPDIGLNNTPVLLNPPIDKAAKGQIFVHNPAAFDPDGDSISYKLTVCTEENGQAIEDYTLPLSSDTLYINDATGDLIWDSPVDTGIYNIAIEIEEWRYFSKSNKYAKIGSIARDMQIDVYNTDNRPPVNMPLQDFCLEAGEFLQYDIVSTDPDSDRVVQYAVGGPLNSDFMNPASFDTILTGRGFSVSRFSWQTACNHIRYQPYNIIIKAEDRNPELNLVDISNFHIKVIGPPPENPFTTPTSNAINLEWDPPSCLNVEGYEIYRRDGRSNYIPDSCTNGIPGNTEYVLIGYNPGVDSTIFMDNNEGEGLVQGTEYCYMVLAIYNGSTPGYVSAEVCDVLVPGTPAILQSSVENADLSGEILITWAKPLDLDTIPAPGPYEYILYRSDLDPFGTNLKQIYSFITSDLNDTSYLDSPLNTLEFPYSYKLELYNDAPGNRFLIGRQEVVSSTWLEIEGMDNANQIHVRKNTPWVNDEFIIYRQDPLTMNFDSIGYSMESTYIDRGLANGLEVCYRIKTIGRRTVNQVGYNAINLTHIGCGTPIDTIPPCPPQLSAESFCDSNFNYLVWSNPNNYCSDDVVKYNLYYSPLMDASVLLIDSTLSPTDTTYYHVLPESLAGCYAVTAIDSFNNESNYSVITCVDNCIDYLLPNVFTPNGDGINDFFTPSNYSFVERVDMKIYNRWGMLVYKTEDPDINWDGKRMNSNQLVPPGVYYYVCDVYENRLTGLEVRNIVGFVYVFTEADAINPIDN